MWLERFMALEQSLNKIVNILKTEGCSEVFLFGSYATGHATADSDIDIGVKGLVPAKFFSVYSRLETEIPEKIDFVDFDEQVDFFDFLSSIGELKKLG